MVLNHVARGSYAVVVTGPATNSDIFCHRDLNVVNVVGVPQGFEQLICKTQSENVLHRLFAEVVVDSKNRVCWKHRFDNRIELSRRG